MNFDSSPTPEQPPSAEQPVTPERIAEIRADLQRRIGLDCGKTTQEPKPKETHP